MFLKFSMQQLRTIQVLHKECHVHSLWIYFFEFFPCIFFLAKSKCQKIKMLKYNGMINSTALLVYFSSTTIPLI